MNTFDVRMTAARLLAAWRPQSSHLVLDTRAAPRLGSRLAARLTLEGTCLGATVLGSVGSVLRAEAGHRIELVPDPAGVAAVRLLAAAAQGRAVRFHERAPRLVARLPAVLRSAKVPRYLDTHSVSAEGCRLRWSGPPPEAGEPIALRIGAGPFAANLEGLVKWVATSSHQGAAVGVALVGGAASTGWLRWLERVQGAGAPFL